MRDCALRGEGREVKGGREKMETFDDLEAYARLCELHLEINQVCHRGSSPFDLCPFT